MRQVLVTDGGGGARIDHGWQIRYFGVGDLVDAVAQVQREPLNLVLQDWSRDFDLSRIAADPLKWDGDLDQAKLYLAMKICSSKPGEPALRPRSNRRMACRRCRAWPHRC